MLFDFNSVGGVWMWRALICLSTWSRAGGTLWWGLAVVFMGKGVKLGVVHHQLTWARPCHTAYSFISALPIPKRLLADQDVNSQLSLPSHFCFSIMNSKTPEIVRQLNTFFYKLPWLLSWVKTIEKELRHKPERILLCPWLL